MKSPALGLLLAAALMFTFALLAASCGGDDDDNDSADDDADDDTSDEETWTDETTGLMWQNGEDIGAESADAATAAAYCDALVWAGFDDWRVPTISELRGLVRGCEDTVTGGSCQVRDDCTSQFCWTIMCQGCAESGGSGSDGAYRPAELTGAAGAYWSSTTVPDSDGEQWTMDESLGAVVEHNEAANRVRCVRGEGSGLTDETGIEYRASFAILVGTAEPTSQSVPVQGAHCDLLDLDGVVPAEPISVRSDDYGWCNFIFSKPFTRYSAKITASGFLDTYMVHFPRFERDDAGNVWGWIQNVFAQPVLEQLYELVGLTPDAGQGTVLGSVLWLPTVPTPMLGGAQPVGCAQITPAPENLFFLDAMGVPSDERTTTNPASGGFLALNQEPSAGELTISTGDASVTTGSYEVFPNSWTSVMAVFPESDYPVNPTPGDCE